MVIPGKPLNIAVIGSGILGAAIAWRLAQRGVRVALIDKGEPGHGASSHSFAWINAGAKEPIRPGGRRGVGGPGAATPVLGLPDPNEGQVEPQMVVDACLRRLREMGCEIHADTEVYGFERHDDGRIHGLVTASGSRDVDAVVIAAGTATTRLAALAGVNVPQAESPGVVIRTNPLPPLLHNVPVVYAPPLDDGRREIHLRQCADGRLMIGEGDQESLAEDDTQAHADDLLARACRYLLGLAGAQAVPVPVGWRPMPLDGYPVMGFASEAPNLYVALTHSGVTLAPALSQLAAQEICDGTTADAVLGPYRPQRFAGLTPEEAAAATHPRAAKMR